MNSRLRPNRFGEPADRRGHDRGGDDVGGQHPVDLVERGREAALHVGQRHIGDGGVERLHDGRAHGADRHHGAARVCDAGAGQLRRRSRLVPSLRKARARAEQRSERAAAAGVDVDSHAHAGAQQRDVLPASKTMRTGTRCTTLTQLPLAFCGGRIANCAPVPGLTEATVPWKVRSGKVSTSIVDLLADAEIGDVGFLRIGVDPRRAVVDDAEHRRAGGHEAAELDVVDLRRRAGDRRPEHGVVEVALGLVERRLGLLVGREIFDRQIGIARAAGSAYAASCCWPKLQLQLGRQQRRLGVVEVDLRAACVGGQRGLALDVAAA